MNHWTDRFSGVRYSADECKKNISEAKAKKLEEQREEHGYNFCVHCSEMVEHGARVPDTMEYKVLDCSHDVSVDDCKRNKNGGHLEMCWWDGNIEILCRHHHNLHHINSKNKNI